MKKYINPDIQITAFAVENILTVSGPGPEPKPETAVDKAHTIMRSKGVQENLIYVF